MSEKTDFNEYEMFQSYKATHEKEIKDLIVEHYIYIAQILARRFQNKGVDYEDIYQVACLGLLLAVDRFEPEKNVKFASFATPTILGEIKRYFRDKGFVIKIPRKLYEVLYKAEHIKQQSFNENMSIDELASVINIPADVLRKAYDAGDSAFIKSLEEETHSDGDRLYIDTVGADDKNFIMIENKDFFDSVFKQLSEKEREFIEMRYYNEQPQKVIAEAWDVSQMQVSRFEKKLLLKLKDAYFR